MKVIVNADDLGASREVNDAIFQCMSEHRVTSATLLANGAAVEQAAVQLQAFPQCSFGVHLNASEFQPLTIDPDLSPILNKEGCFAGNALREVGITSQLRAAIFREWCAQIERVQALGVRVSHLDSHHHMHTVPRLFPVLKRLQKRFEIRKVRLTLNIFARGAPAGLVHRAKKAAWNFALRNIGRTVTTDGFTSLETFLGAAEGLDHRFRSIELMVHPGGRDYEEETRLLSGDWLRSLPFESELVSYHEL